MPSPKPKKDSTYTGPNHIELLWLFAWNDIIIYQEDPA